MGTDQRPHIICDHLRFIVNYRSALGEIPHLFSHAQDIGVFCKHSYKMFKFGFCL